MSKEQVIAEMEDEMKILDKLSNNSIKLISKGQLNEAESIAKKIMKQFPEMHDGFERMGMIYEERKNYAQAEIYYQKAAEVVKNNQGYEPNFGDWLIKKADKMGKKANKK